MGLCPINTAMLHTFSAKHFQEDDVAVAVPRAFYIILPNCITISYEGICESRATFACQLGWL
jgi:hypothetical protein